MIIKLPQLANRKNFDHDDCRSLTPPDSQTNGKAFQEMMKRRDEIKEYLLTLRLLIDQDQNRVLTLNEVYTVLCMAAHIPTYLVTRINAPIVCPAPKQVIISFIDNIINPPTDNSQSDVSNLIDDNEWKNIIEFSLAMQTIITKRDSLLTKLDIYDQQNKQNLARKAISKYNHDIASDLKNINRCLGRT